MSNPPAHSRLPAKAAAALAVAPNASVSQAIRRSVWNPASGVAWCEVVVKSVKRQGHGLSRAVTARESGL